MANLTDTFENQLIDWIFRGQAAPTLPANLFVALYTAAPSDAGGGTEVTGGSYARASVARSLANFAGTQGAGTTVASTGTGGATSNNVAITFAAPTANWGSITHFGIFDAVTGGNLLIHGALTTAKTVNNGDAAPSFAAAALGFTLAEAVFAVGQQVRVLPPFGDGAKVFEIVAVQHVSAAGEIVPEPAESVQYILEDESAYAPQWLEAAE